MLISRFGPTPLQTKKQEKGMPHPIFLVTKTSLKPPASNKEVVPF